MSGVAFLTLSQDGAAWYPAIRAGVGEARLFVHRSAGPAPGATVFESISRLTADLFPTVDGLIFAAPCGVAVRAVAGCLRHKSKDPAVVVLDVRARWCISLVSGHEGGANDLALRVANLVGAEPVITTTTEARKDIIVGVGCRKGTPAAHIVEAVRRALHLAGADLSLVRLLASADVKAEEPGLLEAARLLDAPLRLIASGEIRASLRAFAQSEFVKRKVGLPAVAEPCALLAGRRTRLLLPKTIIYGVTVAVARECSTWSELAREARLTEPAAPSAPSSAPTSS
jgi:cobalt-precorrin 5A hydrolase